jgi:hypothetical protein
MRKMKNINKYKTPQDKIMEWRKWADSESGCMICNLGQHDAAAFKIFLRQAQNNPTILKPRILCNKDICFNAWLHSTTEDKR